MTSPSTIQGACNCGAITVSVPSDAFPSTSIVCHCKNCRASCGSLFSVNLMIPVQHVTIVGQPKVYHDTGDSGLPVKRHFCGDCGSPIMSELGAVPGIPFVKGGLFIKSGVELPPPGSELFWRNHEKWELEFKDAKLEV